jgi:long-chain acyl-CoA synthetase
MTSGEAGIAAEIRSYVERDFGVFADLLRLQVRKNPDKVALICQGAHCSYGELDDLTDRVAAGLQRDGVGAGQVVAICSANSLIYVAVFVGILRTGAAVSPLSPSSTADQLAVMLADGAATHLFLDAVGTQALAARLPDVAAVRVALEDGAQGQALAAWLPQPGSRPAPVIISPGQAFNIIYSSGTTGTPKGIVQPHGMRWRQLHLLDPPGYGPDSVAIISTPLYSNTTLVSLLPALAGGGTVVIMPRFDSRAFLELSQRHRATEAMLVPVQYRRILDVPDFAAFDLSSYRMKFATSAPFSAAWWNISA